MGPVASGKVKDVYDLGDGLIRFHFSDRISAYDVKFAETIPKKGEVLCAFAEFWFDALDVPNHFVRKDSPTDIIVRKLTMLPIECVARGYLYGSLYDRHRRGDAPLSLEGAQMADRLPEPIFDPTTKSGHDVPISREEAVRKNLVSDETYCTLEAMTLEIFKKMSAIADSAGFIMADLKLEFGEQDGRIILADSIGPDEFRLWPKDQYEPGRVQNAYDKQIFRDWLDARGYKDAFEQERAAGRDPVPPPIPPDVVRTITDRYLDVYARITGKQIG